MLGYERLVLWAGSIDEQAKVSLVIVPQQESIRSEEGVGYFVTTETLFELNRLLSSTKTRLIAQVHSHPSEAYHSRADDRYAIVTTEGGFSLVAPDFAAAPFHPLGCAVYRLQSGRWCPLNKSQVKTTFLVL